MRYNSKIVLSFYLFLKYHHEDITSVFQMELRISDRFFGFLIEFKDEFDHITSIEKLMVFEKIANFQIF